MATKKETVKMITPQELVALHEKNVVESLKKYGLNQHMLVHFPKRAKPPLLGRIGAWLVNKSGGIIAIKYSFNNDTITSSSRRKK